MNERGALGRAWVATVLAISILGALLLSSAPQSRAVVGGSPANIEQLPWQALVIVDPENRLCGGSILDSQWIVTVAHCVSGYGPSQIDVHVGVSTLAERSSTNQIPLAEVIVHPSWDAANFRNDIALLKLSTPVTFGSSMEPIALPIGIDAAAWPAVNTSATISGWGATEFGGGPSNQLRSAQVQILGGPGDAACGRYGGNFDAAIEICAGLPGGGVDSCQGDSGSPLVIDVAGTPVLGGLTSVGFECGRADFPGIFTRITTFIPWLEQYLPAAVTSPSVPQEVSVEAIAGERLVVSWKPALVGPAPLAYQAVAQPSGRACSSEAQISTCVIEGVSAGTLHAVTVTGLLPSGTSVSAEPVQVVAVNGVTSPGVRVPTKRWVQWSGLRARVGDKVRLAVPPAARGVCSRLGDQIDPRGVRANAPGLCAVRVSIVKPNGRTQRSTAYAEVR